MRTIAFQIVIIASASIYIIGAFDAFDSNYDRHIVYGSSYISVVVRSMLWPVVAHD
jgi:hypothetical protein